MVCNLRKCIHNDAIKWYLVSAKVNLGSFHLIVTINDVFEKGAHTWTKKILKASNKRNLITTHLRAAIFFCPGYKPNSAFDPLKSNQFYWSGEQWGLPLRIKRGGIWKGSWGWTFLSWVMCVQGMICVWRWARWAFLETRIASWRPEMPRRISVKMQPATDNHGQKFIQKLGGTNAKNVCFTGDITSLLSEPKGVGAQSCTHLMGKDGLNWDFQNTIGGLRNGF